jgi:Zn-dependent protease
MPDWLPELVAAVLAAVIAITLHEAAHGYAALWLGDDTAARHGRLSLNPLRHVDPVGTVLIPGLLLLSQLATIGRVEAMFGWAKPVPVDVRRLRNPRFGMVLVAAAGPAMNFVLAFLAALALHGVPAADALGADAGTLLLRFLLLSMLANIVLALFNLLPIPPLDGGRIAVGLLPAPLALPLARLEPFGLIIVLALLFLLPQLWSGFDPLRLLVSQGAVPLLQFFHEAAGRPLLR